MYPLLSKYATQLLVQTFAFGMKWHVNKMGKMGASCALYPKSQNLKDIFFNFRILEHCKSKDYIANFEGWKKC